MQLHEGILLRTAPYGDYHLMATFFTKENGLITCSAPYSRSPKNRLAAILHPFNEIEFTCTAQNREIEKLKDAQLLHANLELRSSIECLEAASLICNKLLRTQLPEKPAQLLYQLLKKYLKLLPESHCPAAVAASFLMKLLHHEGLLDMNLQGIQNALGLKIGSEEEGVVLLSLGLTTSAQYVKEAWLDPEELKLLIHYVNDAFHLQEKSYT